MLYSSFMTRMLGFDDVPFHLQVNQLAEKYDETKTALVDTNEHAKKQHNLWSEYETSVSQVS